MKPAIGQTVYILPIGNAARYINKPGLIPVKVSKIGRKYFYVESDGPLYTRNLKFHIDTWKQGADCPNLNYKIYADPQDWHDRKERYAICKWIDNQFEYGRLRIDISLETLRTVKSLLEGEKTS